MIIWLCSAEASLLHFYISISPSASWFASPPATPSGYHSISATDVSTGGRLLHPPLRKHHHQAGLNCCSPFVCGAGKNEHFLSHSHSSWWKTQAHSPPSPHPHPPTHTNTYVRTYVAIFCEFDILVYIRSWWSCNFFHLWSGCSSFHQIKAGVCRYSFQSD